MPHASPIDPRQLRPRPGLPFQFRGLQVDLARQMETLDALRHTADFAADCGYNAVVLYLEGRVRCDAFPHRPAAESYSLDDMARLARHLRDRGLQIIPAFNVLGHAEQFMACPELRRLAEEREGGGRFGPGRPSTFDWSLPETRDFWQAYLDELLPVFAAPSVHIGLDECWNLGHSPTSAPRLRDQGLGPLFTDVLLQARQLVATHDAETWIWDDMYEFFPAELERLPRDVTLCHWHYESSVADAGPTAHFGNRARHDWLGHYAELGLRAVVCPWRPWNCQSLTAYAQTRPVIGGIMTQWEMSRDFLAGARPGIAFSGALWSGQALDARRAWVQATHAALPGGENLRDAVELLCGEALALPPAHESAYLAGPVSPDERRAGIAIRQAAMQLAAGPVDDTGRDTMADLILYGTLAAFRLDLRELVPQVLDPRRSQPLPGHLAHRLGTIRNTLRSLAPSLTQLHEQRRPGCYPENAVAAYLDQLQAMIDRLLAATDAAPEPDAAWLQLRLCLSDQHGAPQLSLRDISDGDGPDAPVLFTGSPKARGPSDHGIYLLDIPIRAARPIRQLDLTAWGWGDVGICYLQVRRRTADDRPQRIHQAQGQIISPQALLRDDSIPTRLGLADYHAAILDPSLAQQRASLRIDLAEHAYTAPGMGGG